MAKKADGSGRTKTSGGSKKSTAKRSSSSTFSQEGHAEAEADERQWVQGQLVTLRWADAKRDADELSGNVWVFSGGGGESVDDVDGGDWVKGHDIDTQEEFDLAEVLVATLGRPDP